MVWFTEVYRLALKGSKVRSKSDAFGFQVAPAIESLFSKIDVWNFSVTASYGPPPVWSSGVMDPRRRQLPDTELTRDLADN